MVVEAAVLPQESVEAVLAVLRLHLHSSDDLPLVVHVVDDGLVAREPVVKHGGHAAIPQERVRLVGAGQVAGDLATLVECDCLAPGETQRPHVLHHSSRP